MFGEQILRPTGRPQARMWALAAIVGLVAALLLASLVVLVQQSNHQRDAALARKQHSSDVVMLTSEVEGSLARSEAALARFVVSGDRRTGTIYYDEWRHAGNVIDRLASVLRDDRKQSRRIAQLNALYMRRGQELAGPATLASYKQGWNALGLFALAGRSDTLPRITRILRDVAQAGGALLDERSSAAAVRVDRANDLSRLLSAVGVLLTLSVLALAWLAAIALADRRVARDMAESEGDRAAALEQAVAEGTAELREANRRLTEEAATRAEAEARLRQVQKMDAVGQLTGGIAHDFNNMLAVVVSGLEMARRRVNQQAAEAERHLDSAMEGATRAAALTRRLLSFARAEPLLPSAVDPGALLRDLSDLVDRTIGERIKVRIVSDPAIWPVWIDPYQLENALLNLAVNARDAMAGVGKLVMSTANVRLAPGELGELPAGDYVCLSVQDDGKGMSPATLERVFEPFFTTKPVGQGTGLGLSQILGFARQSGGEVTIASRLEEGTTASIYLPRHAGGAQAKDRRAFVDAPRAATVEGTILVVEDDARVRAATGAALAELGHSAVLCGSGEEAIVHLSERDDITLLITDVVMPGMTGPELVRFIRGHRPDLRVLFVTGYVGEAGEAESFRGAEILRKPFTLRALSDALATMGAGRAPEERAA